MCIVAAMDGAASPMIWRSRPSNRATRAHNSIPATRTGVRRLFSMSASTLTGSEWSDSELDKMHSLVTKRCSSPWAAANQLHEEARASTATCCMNGCRTKLQARRTVWFGDAVLQACTLSHRAKRPYQYVCRCIGRLPSHHQTSTRSQCTRSSPSNPSVRSHCDAACFEYIEKYVLAVGYSAVTSRLDGHTFELISITPNLGRRDALLRPMVIGGLDEGMIRPLNQGQRHPTG